MIGQEQQSCTGPTIDIDAVRRNWSVEFIGSGTAQRFRVKRNTLGQFDPARISRDKLLRLIQERKEQKNDDSSSDD